MHVVFASWFAYLFSAHSFLCKHTADPCHLPNDGTFQPCPSLKFSHSWFTIVAAVFILTFVSALSKQNLNRLNFLSVSQRRASEATNKAALNGLDIDIHNGLRETSSGNSERGGKYIFVPCGRDIKHSERLET